MENLPPEISTFIGSATMTYLAPIVYSSPLHTGYDGLCQLKAGAQGKGGLTKVQVFQLGT